MQTLKINKIYEYGNDISHLSGKYIVCFYAPRKKWSIQKASLRFCREFKNGTYIFSIDAVGELECDIEGFEMPERKLKPVDENCLFKPVLAYDDNSSWYETILLGKSAYDIKLFCGTPNRATLDFGVRSMEDVLVAKRIEGYDYGDGGNWM